MRLLLFNDFLTIHICSPLHYKWPDISDCVHVEHFVTGYINLPESGLIVVLLDHVRLRLCFDIGFYDLGFLISGSM